MAALGGGQDALSLVWLGFITIVLKSRGNFDFHFFDEPGFRFFEIIQNIDRIVQKTMLMYQKRWN